MYQSLKAGRRVKLAHVNLFADGVAVKQVGKETFRLAKALIDEVVLVDTDEICAAIKDIFQDTRSIMEPSGGLALAGIKRYVEREKCSGKTFVAICCGANMNFDRLRFIAERAEMGEHHEALLAVTVPETRGSFRKFCGLIGPRNVTEFNYRIADATQAHVFLSACKLGVVMRPKSWWRILAVMDSRRSISLTMKWPSCTCVTSSADDQRWHATN